MIKLIRRGLWTAGLVLSIAVESQAAVRVVATTEDLASIAGAIGGDRISVQAIARGYQDPHFVEAKPSFILLLHNADLLVVVGRELEAAWLPPLITQSRNARIQPGSRGYLDASLTANILDLPTGPITRAMGDVHPQGNPHYWLDPANGRHIARAVQQKLAELSPDDASYFAQRYQEFDRRLTDGETRWLAAMAPHKGTRIVTYHRSWTNFAERFGLQVVGYVEPKPGIPPSPAHQFTLVQEMKRDGIRIILVEPYFDLKTPNAVARETGATVLVMPPSVGGVKEASDYIALFDYNISLLASTIAKTGAK
ncbi:MAG TPA: metal ABC transporter substrate-binding protein [Vicinamibacterales bacterium]|nr:metal ABC transporter substrate-binding protein [Vicinamibacterales bacterium]